VALELTWGTFIKVARATSKYSGNWANEKSVVGTHITPFFQFFPKHKRVPSAEEKQHGSNRQEQRCQTEEQLQRKIFAKILVLEPGREYGEEQHQRGDRTAKSNQWWHRDVFISNYNMTNLSRPIKQFLFLTQLWILPKSSFFSLLDFMSSVTFWSWFNISMPLNSWIQKHT